MRFPLRGAALAAVAATAMLVAACNGGGGDAPDSAPADVVVTPGDTSVTVTWTAEPGLTYWIFSAAAPSITRDNYNQFAQARITQLATSPQLIAGLVNGSTYSFIVNATRDGGPAGPASPSVSAVPRLAGGTWTVGTPLGADLNALTFGVGKYLAVGAGGVLFSSTSTSADSGSWTTGASGVAETLNGIATNGVTVVAAGDGGTIISSTDGTTWTRVTGVPTTARLNDVAAGFGAFVAVGDGGTIVRSTDAAAWTAISSGTTEDLLGVSAVGVLYVAVGANGTLLTSADGGQNWTARTSGTVAALRSATVSLTLFVAVGDAGTVVTSTDGATWTAQPAVGAQNLRRTVFGSQFIAVGDGGAVFTSLDGLAWTAASSGTTADLRGLLRGPLLNYVAVGAGGANLVSR